MATSSAPPEQPLLVDPHRRHDNGLFAVLYSRPELDPSNASDSTSSSNGRATPNRRLAFQHQQEHEPDSATPSPSRSLLSAFQAVSPGPVASTSTSQLGLRATLAGPAASLSNGSSLLGPSPFNDGHTTPTRSPRANAISRDLSRSPVRGPPVHSHGGSASRRTSMSASPVRRASRAGSQGVEDNSRPTWTVYKDPQIRVNGSQAPVRLPGYTNGSRPSHGRSRSQSVASDSASEEGLDIAVQDSGSDTDIESENENDENARPLGNGRSEQVEVAAEVHAGGTEMAAEPGAPVAASRSAQQRSAQTGTPSRRRSTLVSASTAARDVTPPPGSPSSSSSAMPLATQRNVTPRPRSFLSHQTPALSEQRVTGERRPSQVREGHGRSQSMTTASGVHYGHVVATSPVALFGPAAARGGRHSREPSRDEAAVPQSVRSRRAVDVFGTPARRPVSLASSARATEAPANDDDIEGGAEGTQEDIASEQDDELVEPERKRVRLDSVASQHEGLPLAQIEDG